jgi:hypothetical protein
VTTRLVQSITHRRITDFGLRPAVVAVVVFEVVHTPLGIGLGINLFIAQRARTTLTGIGASIRVKTKLQTLGVGIVGKRLDTVGETRINNNLAVRSTARLPAVIKVDILVANLGKTSVNKSINGVLDQVLVDVTGKLVPAVPPHLRSETKAIVKGTDNSSKSNKINNEFAHFKKKKKKCGKRKESYEKRKVKKKKLPSKKPSISHSPKKKQLKLEND